VAVKTKEEYIESIFLLHPTVYMFGEKITSVVDNPRLRAGIEATGATAVWLPHMRARGNPRVLIT